MDVSKSNKTFYVFKFLLTKTNSLLENIFRVKNIMKILIQVKEKQSKKHFISLLNYNFIPHLHFVTMIVLNHACSYKQFVYHFDFNFLFFFLFSFSFWFWFQNAIDVFVFFCIFQKKKKTEEKINYSFVFYFIC